MRKLLWTACLLIACAGAGAAAVPDENIRAAARRWLEQYNGVGISVGIFAGGERHFFHLGAPQIDGNRPPGNETVYEIGAISRTFAGQLLARAVIEGRASLDDEVDRYLPESYPNLVNGGEKVRLRHLVTSTSQLIDNIPDLTQVRPVPGQSLTVSRMQVIESYTTAEFLRQLKRVAPRLPPGSAPAGSNVGPMLLAVALERIYGEPFDQLLAREIERPLRLGAGGAPAVKLLARGHTDDNQPLPAFGPQRPYLANALRYSVEDLLRYAAWQVMERDASVKLAHRPVWSMAEGRASVGFFWILGDSPQGRRVLSTGMSPGFAAVCDLYPEARIAVVVLTNKAAQGAQETLRTLSEDIVSLLRPAREATGAGISPPPSSADALPPDR